MSQQHHETNIIADDHRHVAISCRRLTEYSINSLITMKLLHLVGSQTSEYYYGVSTMYAPGCIGVLPDVDHTILLARLDGSWSILKSLDEDSVTQAVRLSLPDALKFLEENKPDIMQPHMFCYQGMTVMRYLADMLDIPMIGSPGHVMALTTNKWQSRAVVSSVGVPVPKAQLLTQGDKVNMDPPFLLKPCREDNSMGITLVQDVSELDQALKTAFTFDDQILCEQFVPLGREIRVGVVEANNGELEMLPCMEYYLGHKQLPIRTSADKISTDGGKLSFAPVDRECPAKVDKTLRGKLYDLAVKSHHALGCEHYSLYDVRVDPDGNPYFIEASPYCSFSPKSAIVTMSRGNPEYSDTDLFFRLARKAIREYQPTRSTSGGEEGKAKQQLGMRDRSTLKNISQ